MDFSSLFGSAAKKPLVGLDIGPSSVKMVELSATGKGELNFTIEHYAIEPLPEGAVDEGSIQEEDQVSDAIRRCWSRMGTRTKDIAIALPSTSVKVQSTTQPTGLTEIQLEQQIEGDVSQYMPYSDDERVYHDFCIMGEARSGSEDNDVVIAACKADLVDEQLSCIASAGLNLLIVDVEIFSQQRVLVNYQAQLPGYGEDQAIAIVDVGSAQTVVSLHRNGKSLDLPRYIPLGSSQITSSIVNLFGMDKTEAEIAKKTGNFQNAEYQTAILGPFLDNLAVEVSQSLNELKVRTPDQQIDYCLLFGGGSSVSGIAEAVANRTRVNTMLLNPFSNMNVPRRLRSKLEVDSLSLVVASGLAMWRFV